MDRKANEKTKAIAKVLQAQASETEASRKVEQWLGRLQREARSGKGTFTEATIAGLSKANDALNKAEAIAGAALIDLANTWLE